MFLLNNPCFCYICIGITRLERWERAEEYGLYPPKEVKEIVLQHPHDTVFTEWYVYGLNVTGEFRMLACVTSDSMPPIPFFALSNNTMVSFALRIWAAMDCKEVSFYQPL